MVVRAPLAEQHLHSLDPEKHLQLNQDLLPVSKSEVQKSVDRCQVLAICIDLPCPSAVSPTFQDYVVIHHETRKCSMDFQKQRKQAPTLINTNNKDLQDPILGPDNVRDTNFQRLLNY